MSIRQELYYYKANKRKIVELQEKIEYLRAKAEKITPTLSDDTISGFGNDSKVERNAIKILETENELNGLKDRVQKTSDFIDSLKPYHRHIVISCIVNHLPYSVVAKREKTSIQNISKIISKTLNKNP